MKKVTIPTCSNPFVVNINGKKYTYPAGTEQEVPDEVAVIIEAHEEHHNTGPEPTTPPFGAGGGSASIDVTASVGQTIVVEEVDGNGKPTKWKAAEYQPRTHWEEKDATVVVAERVFTFDPTNPTIQEVFAITPNEVYTVHFDGIPYKCRCIIGAMQGEEGYALGNESLLGYGVNTGEPFIIVTIPSYSMSLIMPADMEATHTIKITHSNIHPLDSRYYDNTFYINLVKNDDDTYSIEESAEEIIKAYRNDLNIVCRGVSKTKISSSGFIMDETQLAMYAKRLITDSEFTGLYLHFFGMPHEGNTNLDFKSVTIAINITSVSIDSVSVNS